MALDDESQAWSGELVAAANDKAEVKHESWYMEERGEENEDVITREMKPTVLGTSRKQDVENGRRSPGRCFT